MRPPIEALPNLDRPGAVGSPLSSLCGEIEGCRACPRLVAWRERVAHEKRRAYRDWEYWGRPVPGFGDPEAWLVIVGLAPAAHGANRTGRMFTGDRSGDFLYAGLHRAGFASQETSRQRGDGLSLRGAYVTAPCRCAPPDNAPAPDELSRCAPFFDRELALLPRHQVSLALGAIAWKAVWAHVGRTGAPLPRPLPRFAHGAVARLPSGRALVGSYHVSQQNTQTGRLTPGMFDECLALAVRSRGS
ncbi:MAG: uracil-DNA glycosylase [Deltaproteobacteria bacterium]